MLLLFVAILLLLLFGVWGFAYHAAFWGLILVVILLALAMSNRSRL